MHWFLGPLAGINTIKSLKMSNFAGKIVATDSTSLSAGFFMADVNEILPEADAQYYVKRLFEIVEKHHDTSIDAKFWL